MKRIMLTKRELVEKISKQSGRTLKESAEILETVVNVFGEAISSGEGIKLTGFGTFEIVERASRTGVNPLTQEKINIPKRKGIKFKASASLKEAVRFK